MVDILKQCLHMFTVPRKATLIIWHTKLHAIEYGSQWEQIVSDRRGILTSCFYFIIHA